MNNYRFVISPRRLDDPRSARYLADAHALGLTAVHSLRCHDLYFIEGAPAAGELSQAELQRLAVELLSDPVTQRYAFTCLSAQSSAFGVQGQPAPFPDPFPHIGEGENDGNLDVLGSNASQHIQISTISSTYSSGLVEVALRPGVTDPVAEQIVRGARELGIAGVNRASTGLRFEIVVEGENQEIYRREHGERGEEGRKDKEIYHGVHGEHREERREEQEIYHGDMETRGFSEDISPVLNLLAKRLLANAVIQRYAIGEIEPVFPHLAEASGDVEILPVCDQDEAGLLTVSHDRRAALDLAEMQAIQTYFRHEEREPSDVEIETIAQTWSEHCGHKTFKAKISLTPGPSPDGRGGRSEAALKRGGEINGLLRTYIRSATEEIAAPWVRSAFVDNAGIIDFDDTYEVSFKVETHNHPSAIEPFGGANTGVGGVIRDVLGVSAKPIANTDVLCFGPQDTPVDRLPEGVLHPRRIQSGVVAGVQDYGNKIGIPTVNGAILYDEGYTANPLVFCGCVGIAPKGSHPRQPLAGDRVIVLGGGTGRDGLRGATFSSMTMDAQTGEVSGASVQIGDPITEKGLIEVLLRARDLRLYHAVTDCGAGGLSSAVGEMSSTIGADVELGHVRLKYAGLAPWEIWLSEAQERMVFAVPAENVPALQAICDTFEVNLTDIGQFSGAGRLVVRYNGKPVLDLENRFLHEGIPQRQLRAKIYHGEHREHGEEENEEIHRGERGERREEGRKDEEIYHGVHGEEENEEIHRGERGERREEGRKDEEIYHGEHREHGEHGEEENEEIYRGEEGRKDEEIYRGERGERREEENEEIYRGEHGEHGEEQRFLNQEIYRGERRERGVEQDQNIYHGDTESTEFLNTQKSPWLRDSVVQDFNDTLLALLAHPNIASKAAVIRIYDHEVQGGTVVKPLTGAENDGPSDACVLKPIGTHGTGGIVLSNGINPEYGKLDAYGMAWSAIDEAIRNAVAVGCDPERIALLDNFCWGDPLRPETLGSLVEACRGCHDAALHFRSPFISGKDSLNNEYLGSDGQRHAIPPTLLISALGLIEDVSRAVTMDLKEAGDLVYMVGAFQPAWGGSHYARIYKNLNRDGQDIQDIKQERPDQLITSDLFSPGEATAKLVPSVPTAAPETYRLVHAAMQAGLVRACHDLSEGGLAVAAAEMCIGGRLGIETGNLDVLGCSATQNIQISSILHVEKKEQMNLVVFGETNGCLLVEVRAEDQAAFESLMAVTALYRLGTVTAEPVLSIGVDDEMMINLPVEQLVQAWTAK